MRGHDVYGRFTVLTGYEGTGTCFMCGSPFPDKRPRRYCSRDCGRLYCQLFCWPDASLAALKRARYKCELCGMSLRGLQVGRKYKVSYYVGERSGLLDVHHKDPLNGDERHWSMKNLPHNLEVLCHECHVMRHTKPRPAKIPSEQLVLV